MIDNMWRDDISAVLYVDKKVVAKVTSPEPFDKELKGTEYVIVINNFSGEKITPEQHFVLEFPELGIVFVSEEFIEKLNEFEKPAFVVKCGDKEPQIMEADKLGY